MHFLGQTKMEPICQYVGAKVGLNECIFCKQRMESERLRLARQSCDHHIHGKLIASALNHSK